MEKEKITVEELLRQYAAGDRDFRNIILEYADLSGVELQNIDLSGDQFNYVNLSRLNLHRCELGSAQFWYCNFTEARITSSHLEYARFFDCDLRGFNSSKCNVSSANFIRVNFQGAKFGGFGEEPCNYWDIIRQDGVFIPGFTCNPSLYSHNNNREV